MRSPPGLGIFGVVSYMVTERTHEIGVRLALGAGRGGIVGIVLRQGLRLAAGGVVAGLAVSVVVSRVMAELLYGVRPTDPLTFIAVTLVLTIVAVTACYLAARRAVRVDPIVAPRG